MFTVERVIEDELPPPNYIKLEYQCHVVLDKGQIVKLGEYYYSVLNVEHNQYTHTSLNMGEVYDHTTTVHLYIIQQTVNKENK